MDRISAGMLRGMDLSKSESDKVKQLGEKIGRLLFGLIRLSFYVLGILALAKYLGS